jgi:glycosyltransferase involved in cell wall biosynthesis
MSPIVSVLIPVYNMELYIEEAIKSVLGQSFTDYELILVDNNSSDKSLDIISKYEHYSNVKIIKNEQNVGMTKNWNTCLYHATGKYIKFLNADDIFERDLLKEFVTVMENDLKISLVTSYFKNFGNSDHHITYAKVTGKQNGKEAIMNTIPSENWIGCPTQVMFRRSDLYVGYFNISSAWWSDIDLWYRLLTIGDLYVVGKVLSQNRAHPNQVSNQFGNYKSLLSHYDLLRYLEQSDNFTFCNELLLSEIKKIKFIVFYESIMNIFKGNIKQGFYLLNKSDISIFSFAFFRVPFFYFNKKTK